MNTVKDVRAFLPLLVALLCAVCGSAAPPSVPQAAKPAETPLVWGPPSAGLVSALGVEGDARVGGSFRIRLSLRSAAGQTIGLPSAGEAFGWVVIGQSLGDSKSVYYSEKVPMAGARRSESPVETGAAWPGELGGGGVVRLGPFDLSAATVFPSKAARSLLTAYLSGKDDADLPKAAGKLNEVLVAGRATAKFILCLPHEGKKPMLVTSAVVPVTVGPPDMASLKPDAREKFLSDLMKQFNRNPWAGQQAHDTCVQLGKEVLPHVLKAAFETGRPSHARLWLTTTLADIRDPRSARALITLLDGPAGGIRNVVAYHGVKQRSDRLDKALLAKVKASDATSRLAAWTLLGFMVHRSSVPEEVLKAGLESDDPRARGTAAEVLAAHASETNIRRLVALLADASERVRGVAARMLGKSKNRSPGVLGALVKALDLPGETARQRVCDALSELTAKDLPYDPAAAESGRAATIAAWKAWWAEKKPRR